ncbi:MAG: putative membrane-anchored protein [Candidatus Azotimanducaceae bacterium]|jgi:uncharacterized membrane-anchored protein
MSNSISNAISNSGPMKRYGIIGLVILQIAILAYMAAGREYLLAYGKEVWLRTAPIDPRDPFRGDFVRLRYAISNLPANLLTDGEISKEEAATFKGQIIYVSLQPDAGQVYRFKNATLDQPANGTFLKGRVTNAPIWPTIRLDMKYGIEQLFVEQGKGKEIEEKLGTRDAIQVPMEVLLAVGDSGTSTIKDYRWSELGIKLEITRQPRDPNQNPQQFDVPLSPAVRVTLRNMSAEALRLDDAVNHCQFSLVAAQDPAHKSEDDRDLCDLEPHREKRHLAPGEAAVFEIDLAKPRWFVEHNGERVTIGKTDDINRMYRLVYHGTAEPDGWQGQLPSRAFNAQGRID